MTPNYDCDLDRLKQMGLASTRCYDKLFLALNVDTKAEMQEYIRQAISEIEDIAIEWGTLDED